MRCTLLSMFSPCSPYVLPMPFTRSFASSALVGKGHRKGRSPASNALAGKGYRKGRSLSDCALHRDRTPMALDDLGRNVQPHA